ncbi:hypothetical protein N878_12640 [Pseudomonas sp. EGD-AK9]|nr:hypothetical protein N878_12640 [Pseudomonas sp. EGD-AK9]
MITPEVVAYFYSVHATSTANQSIETRRIFECPDHHESFYVKALEKLLGARLIRLNFLSSLLTANHIHPDRGLKGASQ